MTRLAFAPVIPLSVLAVLIALALLVTLYGFATRARGAWAVDRNGRFMSTPSPGGELQREMAFRFGINLVMYALTGNYKADQVHIPALLERLGQ